MTRTSLSAKVTVGLILLGALAAWGATASFVTPANDGTIFAVINANRSAGALTTSISVKWGAFQRTANRGNPYGNCAGSIAGFVLMVRNAGYSKPFTLTTNGTIVRAPYQGAPPPEVSHACYKLEKMRATP